MFAPETKPLDAAHRRSPEHGDGGTLLALMMAAYPPAAPERTAGTEDLAR